MSNQTTADFTKLGNQGCGRNAASTVDFGFAGHARLVFGEVDLPRGLDDLVGVSLRNRTTKHRAMLLGKNLEPLYIRRSALREQTPTGAFVCPHPAQTLVFTFRIFSSAEVVGCL